MRIWSFVQQKGGSGKSTICTNLAVVAEENGETVLIVDLDPQSSATLWHFKRGTNKPNVLDAIPDKLTNIIESAATLGVTLCLVDSPSKLDATALAAIRAADMIICPTLPDLFNLGSLQDTVQLLETAEKLDATVGVINNVDEAGAEPRIGEAKAAIEGFKHAGVSSRHLSSPAVPDGRREGQGRDGGRAKAKKAADEIRALWAFLDKRAKQLEAGKAKTKVREAAKS